MKKKKVKYSFTFDIGDTVWRKYGGSFVVQTIEVHKEGIIYRCGNPGTKDYWSFFEYEIGTYAFPTKEEQETALEASRHAQWEPDGGFNVCSNCKRVTMQPQLTGKTHNECPFCHAIMDSKGE